MNGPLITRKQYTAAIFVSLLSPMMRLLPHGAVGIAGRAAFLSVIPAVPLLMALSYLMSAYRRYMRPGEGLGGLLMRWLGPVFGRIVLVLFGLWLLFYAGFILRSGAERLVSTVYPNSGPGPFVVTLLVLCALTALGPVRALSRTAVLLRALLFTTLALVFIFSISSIDTDNLRPITWHDAGPVMLGAWPFATVGAVGAYFAFLSGYVEQPKNTVGWLLGPLGIFLATAALICFEVVGVFGPSLAGALSYPFFVMIRDISILDILPRIEAVVIAVWVLADFILCAMLLRCAHEALRPIFRLPAPEGLPMKSFGKGRWLQWIEAIAVFGCTQFFIASSQPLELWSNHVIPIISDCFTFGALTLLWLITAPRRKREQRQLGQQ